ncbi:hypothetical protein CL655_01095 [bacterium]|nr:hypothetical protein [bacterium]|tara:strand:+ start:523 stop:1122 length:600 start_codon:yes stop_codon:yes gene_type:complete
MPDENDIVFDQYSIDIVAMVRAILDAAGASAPTIDSVLGFLNSLWGTFVVISLLLALLFFIGYIYAAIRFNQLAEIELEGIKEQERLYQQLFGQDQPSRFDDIKKHIASDNPNDWKLAIIEADIELERMLDNAGYPGLTIGDKLKGANKDSFTTLNDAWEAHKVRNRIAHDGADFVLTKRLAQETITRYQRVFAEFNHR